MSRPTSLPRILELLQAEGELSGAQICSKLSMMQNAFARASAPAVADGRILRRRDGRVFWYSLGEQPHHEAAEAAEDAEDEPVVRFALWDDGDLQLWGLNAADDGSVTVDAAVVAKIRARLTGAAC